MSHHIPPSDHETPWEVSGGAKEDPEELRVIFSTLDSFSQYAKVSHFHCTHLRRQSFYAMAQSHWQMLAAPPFNYLETLDRVDEAIETNAELAHAILHCGARSFGLIDAGGGDGQGSRVSATSPNVPWSGIAKSSDVDKARSTLRQFYRDWSAEGAEERELSYGPVKKALAAEVVRRQSGSNSGRFSVLVPGAGLGRLVFDLCAAGYDVEGNEISYHQLLASSYVLNFTEHAGQHTIYPWIHSFSNHHSRADQFRSCRIPDIHPGQALTKAAAAAAASESPETSSPGSMSMSAADFLCLYSDAEHAGLYDAVACVFFLDTAPNLVRYLETVRHCLRPGGLLINIGPLLWHFENNAPGNHGRDDDGDGEHDATASSGIADPGSFELTDDEAMALVAKLGFELVERRTDVETPYIQDASSMLHTVYRSSFWVARKPW